MTETPPPGPSRTADSAELVSDLSDDDPADLAGAASSDAADGMHAQVDEIAENADPDAPGHGT